MTTPQPGSDVALAIQNTGTPMPDNATASSYNQRGFFARRRMLFTKIGVLLLFVSAWKWGNPSLFHIMAWPGLILILGGMTMRIWAAGYLRKQDALAVSGPYALMRHPLYFGTGLIVCGQSFLGCVPLLPLIAVSAWYALYRPVMREEEEYLAGCYGSLYEEYRNDVPALLPRLDVRRRFEPSATPSVSSTYSWAQVWRNREYEGAIVHLGLTAAYLWLYCL